LKGEGLEVLDVATNATEGLAAAHRERPDVLLIDLVLPDGDGTSVGREVVEKLPETKVLALTALSDPRAVSATLKAGFHGFLTKAARLSQLVESIRAAVGGQVVIPHRLARRAAGALSAEEKDAALRARQLTVREWEVLALLCEGGGGQEIARRLSVSRNTVRTHVQNILMKLDVHSRLEAVAFAVRHGLAKVAKSGDNHQDYRPWAGGRSRT
jgi:two-component system nitrate/nitrite response regulator NarL